MLTRKLVKLCLVSCSILISPIATAGFSTYAKDWPNDAGIVGEDRENVDDDEDDDLEYEDNSKVTIKKVSSNLKDDTPEEDDDDNFNYKRMSENYRLYVKAGLNVNHARFKNIKNYSYNALTNATVTTTGLKRNSGSWEAGFGTRINALRYEIEYIQSKNIPYNPQPIFKGRSEKLTSTVTNTSILLNIFYDIPDFKAISFTYVRPYIGALIGPSWNKSRSTMQGGLGRNAPKNYNKIGMAWGYTFGIRVPIASRWGGYLGYRYVRLPRAVWKDSTNVLLLKSKYSMFSINMGISFII